MLFQTKNSIDSVSIQYAQASGYFIYGKIRYPKRLSDALKKND